MSLIKVKISEIGDIKDVEGKYGPQKKVNIRESLEGGDRWLSGFVSSKAFNASDWVAGKVHELEVWQNGKYWNFKIPSKTAKANDDVMGALRELYKLCKEIQKEVRSLHDDKLTSTPDDFPLSDAQEPNFP